jgi:hypothetical protein
VKNIMGVLQKKYIVSPRFDAWRTPPFSHSLGSVLLDDMQHFGIF